MTLRILVGCKRVIDYAVKVDTNIYDFYHCATNVWPILDSR